MNYDMNYYMNYDMKYHMKYHMNYYMKYHMNYYIIKIKIHSSCEIEDFVETHLCKLCVILRSRALRVVCPH